MEVPFLLLLKQDIKLIDRLLKLWSSQIQPNVYYLPNCLEIDRLIPVPLPGSPLVTENGGIIERRSECGSVDLYYQASGTSICLSLMVNFPPTTVSIQGEARLCAIDS